MKPDFGLENCFYNTSESAIGNFNNRRCEYMRLCGRILVFSIVNDNNFTANIWKKIAKPAVLISIQLGFRCDLEQTTKNEKNISADTLQLAERERISCTSI